jgi:heptosyltransferase I
MPPMLKLLIIKTSSLGDVVHNLPIVNDILSRFPNAQIDWVVEESFVDIPHLHPNVNHVFTVSMRRWRKALFKCNTWHELKQVRRQIASQPYDYIIDTQGLVKSAVISSFASGARHGYDKHSIREPLASLFYTQTHAISYLQHAVIRNRTLAALSLGYSPPTNAPDYGVSANEAIPSDLTPTLLHPYIIALHGTSRDSKLWPEAHWIAFGKAIALNGLNLVLPWASMAEQSRAQNIARQIDNAIVLPKLNISSLAPIIANAKAAVGVDTGLSHLAVALSIPTIAIYTDTDPARTGVMAGAKAQAVNLGNKNITPSPAEVLSELNQFL